MKKHLYEVRVSTTWRDREGRVDHTFTDLVPADSYAEAVSTIVDRCTDFVTLVEARYVSEYPLAVLNSALLRHL
jgi:hypothetical protein